MPIFFKKEKDNVKKGQYHYLVFADLRLIKTPVKCQVPTRQRELKNKFAVQTTQLILSKQTTVRISHILERSQKDNISSKKKERTTWQKITCRSRDAPECTNLAERYGHAPPSSQRSFLTKSPEPYTNGHIPSPFFSVRSGSNGSREITGTVHRDSHLCYVSYSIGPNRPDGTLTFWE
jgi:hypothetical protein